VITESEIYTGVVLARLALRLERPFSIANLPEFGSSYFRLGKRAGLHVKYCQNRLSPWTFTFTKDQKIKLAELSDVCANVVVALVCERNGVAALSLGDVWSIIKEPQENAAQASISVSRRPRQQYTVKGSFGSLVRKVADNELENWVAGSLG
jgi:hypothetical protein